MRKHAFLNGNIVVKVESITEETWYNQILLYSSIIDIEDENLDIQAGWYFTSDGWSEGAEYVEPVPVSISPRQIRLALLGAGVTSQMILDSLNSLDEPLRSMALIEWEYSSFFARDHQLIPGVASSLGWTSEQLDQLWIQASRI